MSDVPAGARPAAGPPPGARRLGRGRALAFGVVLVALIGSAAGVVAFGVDSLRDTTPALTPLESTGTSVVPDVDPAPRGLLVQQGADGLVGVTVLVTRDGGGGHLVLVPVGTMVEVPSFGLRPLREAFDLGGVDLVAQSVENLTGVVFDHVGAVDAAGLVDLVAPAGTLRVELGAAVEVVDDAGRVQQAYPAGPVDVAPAEVPELLAVRGEGTDLDRLVRHQAVWAAWLAAIGDDPAAAPADDAAGGVGGLVADLAGGEVGTHLLPVEVLAAGTGAGDDLYSVRGDALDELVAEVAPGGVAGAERVRVQVLNGTGTPGLAQEVQPALAPTGVVVALSGNADRFDYETTQVVFYRDEDLDAARAVQRALGLGEVVRSLVALDVVDVTVVIGADYAARSATDPAPGADAPTENGAGP